MGAGGFLVLSVFLACCVEAVEALTVILATGVTRVGAPASGVRRAPSPSWR